MLENTKAVIFDLDGTLMDSMWVWKDIDIEYLGRYGCELHDSLPDEIEGMSFTETAVYFKKYFSIPDSIEEIKAEWNSMAYEKYAREIFLKPGAKQFLEDLKDQGMPVGIASSNSRELIEACLRSNHVESCFDVVATACEVAHGKPSPDIYLHVAEALSVKPGECLVFEDVPMGILAGKNAGMRVCAVEDAFSLNQKDKIRRLADYYIRSYDEIPR